MDILTREERSENMRRIRSKDTKPEVYFRQLLHAKGYRYSLGSKKVPGHPDLWMPKYNLAVFVHGCFWHRHEGCKYAYTPKSRIEFWSTKFEANMRRDETVRRQLEEAGIRQMIIWECTVKRMKRDDVLRAEILSAIEEFICSDRRLFET